MVLLVLGIFGVVIGVIGGVIFIEIVFVFLGMGKMLIDFVKVFNNFMVVGFVFIFICIFIFLFFLGDIWMIIIDLCIKLIEKGGK